MDQMGSRLKKYLRGGVCASASNIVILRHDKNLGVSVSENITAFMSSSVNW